MFHYAQGRQSAGADSFSQHLKVFRFAPGEAKKPSLVGKRNGWPQRKNVIYNSYMPEYRRAKIEAGTYFFTLVTYQRQNIFLSPEARLLFLDAINYVKQYRIFELIAYCVLPDHIHLIISLPENDADFSTRLSLIKRRFTKQYTSRFGGLLPKSESYAKRKEVGIWQRRFWEHFIRGEEDLNRHIDYIHYNPVKHGLVGSVCDWKDSSFYDYVKSGHYTMDWGQDYKFYDHNYQFGE